MHTDWLPRTVVTCPKCEQRTRIVSIRYENPQSFALGGRFPYFEPFDEEVWFELECDQDISSYEYILRMTLQDGYCTAEFEPL